MPLEKEKKKPQLAPARRLSFAANLADTPSSNEVKAPTYIEKGTAGYHRGRSSNRSDRGRVGMGWQERTARNAQIDANYRAALGASSNEGIAADTNRTSIIREGMGNRTARDIARGRNETDIKGTRIRTGALISNRKTMEEGMDRRQGLQHEFLGTQQEDKFGFLEGESQKERDIRLQLVREREAADMARTGVFTDPQQVSDYMGDPEFEQPGGLGAVGSFNKGATSSEYQYIPPQFKSRTDLRQGIVSSEEVSPGGVFNKTQGTFQKRTVNEESIMKRFYDDATGKTTIPMNELSDTELSVIIKKLREKKSQETEE